MNRRELFQLVLGALSAAVGVPLLSKTLPTPTRCAFTFHPAAFQLAMVTIDDSVEWAFEWKEYAGCVNAIVPHQPTGSFLNYIAREKELL